MIRTLLRAVAILAGSSWAWFFWRACHAPESRASEEWRTVAFVVAFISAALGWPSRPQKPGGRNKERL